MAVMTSFLSLLEPLTEPKMLREAWSEDDCSEEESPDDWTAALAEQAQMALEEAQDTLAQARRDADMLRDDAHIQAEALREAAWQEGFHDGEQAARTQVEAELNARWESQREEFQREAADIVESIGAARQALWEAQEAEMVAFVLDIARQVIKTEVTQNPEVVGSVLRNALRRVTDKDHVRIRVSVGDAPAVREMRDDLLSLLDGIKNLEILDDRRVGDGGCVVETNAGTIDAKIETQIAEVERALSNAIEG
jgi:flagellar assembly protein FliH